MIDYRWVTEDTKAEFEAVLRKHGLKFLRWRIRSENRKAQSFAAAFAAFWLQKGPVGFRTTDDAFRFKKDLAEFIQRTMLSETPELLTNPAVVEAAIMELPNLAPVVVPISHD